MMDGDGDGRWATGDGEEPHLSCHKKGRSSSPDFDFHGAELRASDFFSFSQVTDL
jgi:hypothetical protein